MPTSTRQVASPARAPTAERIVVEVWELQRRVTLFHTTWHPPFLPHESIKHWRWLDRAYAPHAWLDGSKSSCAAADAPPVRAPAGWRQDDEDSGWHVVEARDSADGWQYAVDFYHEDSWWGLAAELAHCRRRLWRCAYVAAADRPGEAAAPSRAWGTLLAFPRLPLLTVTDKCVDETSGPSVGADATQDPPSDAAASADKVGYPAKAPDGELTTVLQATISPLDLAREAQLLFADDWGAGNNMLVDLLVEMGSTEIEVAPWAELSDSSASGGVRHGMRQVSARLVVPPAPMAPKTTRATLTYWLSFDGQAAGGPSLRMESTVVLHETPYCDTFHVFERLSLTSSSVGTCLSKAFACVFSKRTLAQSMIRSGTEASQRKACVTIEDFYLRRASGGVAKPGDPSDGSSEDAALDLGRYPVRAPEGDLTSVLRASIPPLDLAREAQLLFAEAWGPGNMLMDFLAATDATEIEVAPWVHRESDGLGGGVNRGMRQVHLRLPVPPSPMAPKTTRATITYWISLEETAAGGREISVESAIVVHDTPYCDYFHVSEKLALTSSSAGTDISKAFACVFTKRTLAQSMIQSSSAAVQRKAGERLEEFFRQRADGGTGKPLKSLDIVPSCTPSTSAASSPRRAVGDASCGSCCETTQVCDDKLVVNVWELQRRFTLFHATWTAPFLPHDGEKKWRWLNNDYQRHWMASFDEFEEHRPRRADVARGDRPDEVLKPPPGWRLQTDAGGWRVVKAQGPCDAEGWQYAADFYSNAALWVDSPAWLHCRRRRWQAVFEFDRNVAGVAAALERASPQDATRTATSAFRLRHAVALLILALLFAVVLFFCRKPLSARWAATAVEEASAGDFICPSDLLVTGGVGCLAK